MIQYVVLWWVLIRKQSFLCDFIFSSLPIILINSVDSLIQDNPEAAMDSIVHITQHMTPSQRSEVSRILANMDTWCRKSNSHNSVFKYLWTNRFVITLNIFLSKTDYTKIKYTAAYYQFYLSYALFTISIIYVDLIAVHVLIDSWEYLIYTCTKFFILYLNYLMNMVKRNSSVLL